MTTTTPVDIAGLITSTPGVQGGQPCLAGTRIRVLTIAVWAIEGLDADAILAEFPHVDLARIHAALAYYYANQALVEEAIEAERRLGEELMAKYPNGWTRDSD